MRNRFFLILSFVMVLCLSVNTFVAASGVMDFSKKDGQVVEEEETADPSQAAAGEAAKAEQKATDDDKQNDKSKKNN